MNKKIIICVSILCVLIIAVILGFFIKNKASQNKDIVEYYSLGDTVSTDILSFQLISSEFTYALDSAGNPKEYNEQEDKNNTRVASKGHTLVAFTFLVENKDRTEIYIGDEERLGNKKILAFLHLLNTIMNIMVMYIMLMKQYFK